MSTDIAIELSLERSDFELDVELELPGQGITVLFGPSGSGKTTVLRCVAGLERGRGRIRIGEQVWQDTAGGVHVPTWQRDLGYVFQEASLFAHLNVKQNLEFGMKRGIKRGLKRNNKPDTSEALSEAIELLGIGHLLKRASGGLSGGERQRVAIARALALRPSLLLLDEPLASLDQARREEILPWLERLHANLRMPVLYVTHAMQELTRLADHVVLLDTGRVKLDGATDRVLSDAAFSAGIGAQAGTVLQATVAGDDETFHLTQLVLPGGQLWVAQQSLQKDSQVRVHVHANDVSLAVNEPTDTSIQNRLAGVITAISADAHPAHRLVTVNCGSQALLARVTARALQDMQLEIGCGVWCQIKSVALAGH